MMAMMAKDSGKREVRGIYDGSSIALMVVVWEAGAGVAG